MHLIFKLLVNVPMVEVGVREEAVQPAHNIVQVLLRVLWDGHAVEVIRVDYGR